MEYVRTFLYPPQPYRRVIGMAYLALSGLWLVIVFQQVGHAGYAAFAGCLGAVSIAYLRRR